MLVALPLRILLDFTSIRNPKPGYDLAYTALFLVVGVVVLIDGAESMWGYVALGLSAWSLFSYFIKRKKAKHFNAKNENT